MKETRTSFSSVHHLRLVLKDNEDCTMRGPLSWYWKFFFFGRDEELLEKFISSDSGGSLLEYNISDHLPKNVFSVKYVRKYHNRVRLAFNSLLHWFKKANLTKNPRKNLFLRGSQYLLGFYCQICRHFTYFVFILLCFIIKWSTNIYRELLKM